LYQLELEVCSWFAFVLFAESVTSATRALTNFLTSAIGNGLSAEADCALSDLEILQIVTKAFQDRRVTGIQRAVVVQAPKNTNDVCSAEMPEFRN